MKTRQLGIKRSEFNKYLVGVRINANSLCGLSKSDCITGKANAPVLPEPVSANPIKSSPEIQSDQFKTYRNTLMLKPSQCFNYATQRKAVLMHYYT